MLNPRIEDLPRDYRNAIKGAAQSLADRIDRQIMGQFLFLNCPYCNGGPTHLHDCLDRMNKVRTPDGDWWKV